LRKKHTYPASVLIALVAFPAMIVGGMDSPAGAVAGGLMLGVLLNMLSYLTQYDLFDWFSEELRLPMALLVILVVLLVRPSGLFGHPEVKRV